MKTGHNSIARILMGLLPVFQRLLPFLIKLYPLLDRFLPFFASKFLNRTMMRWKNEGLIESYRIKAEKTGKLHYKIEIQITITSEKLETILTGAINELFETFKM